MSKLDTRVLLVLGLVILAALGMRLSSVVRVCIIIALVQLYGEVIRACVKEIGDFLMKRTLRLQLGKFAVEIKPHEVEQAIQQSPGSSEEIKKVLSSQEGVEAVSEVIKRWVGTAGLRSHQVESGDEVIQCRKEEGYGVKARSSYLRYDTTPRSY